MIQILISYFCNVDSQYIDNYTKKQNCKKKEKLLVWIIFI